MCAVFQMNPFLSSRDVIAQIFDLICFFFYRITASPDKQHGFKGKVMYLLCCLSSLRWPADLIPCYSSMLCFLQRLWWF